MILLNLWLRLLLLLICSPFRERLQAPFDISQLSFRVLPTDLDVNLHMNNGRYLTLMDLGRYDLMVRMGLWKHARKHGWMPVLSAANVVFRRELRLFQKFDLDSRLLWWSGTHVLMEHRLLTSSADGSRVLAAKAIMHGGFYERANRRFVPASEVLAALGTDVEPPALTPEIEAVLVSVKAAREPGSANAVPRETDGL